MKLRVWLFAAACALAVAVLVIRWRAGDEPGARPVPLGATVTQTLPGPDGKPEVWKLSKQEVPREALPDLVLPQPDPKAGTPHVPSDSARAYEGQALESWKHGDIATALEKFELAVAADPDDPEVRTQYGRLLTLMTDYERAYPQLERAAQLKPEDAQVWLDLQTLYERNTLLERAHYARQKAEAAAPGQPIERDENGFYFLPGGKLFP